MARGQHAGNRMHESTIEFMSNDVKPSTALVILSGESIWPILSQVCHCRALQKGPAAVFIFHTAQPAESLLPAMRLRHMLHTLFPDVQVVLPDVFSSLAPREIRAQINQWLESRSDTDWVMLGSSGSTAWNLALASFAGHPRVGILGQDDTRAWQHWLRPEEENGIVMEKGPELALDATDTLAIEHLLRSQFVTSDKIPSYTADKGRSLPLHRLTEVGAANSWDWPAAFKDSGLETAASPAGLFAQYLAAGLTELGISNLAHGIRIAPQSDAPNKENIKIDLAANFHGQLVLFDVKLEEENTDDPRQSQSVFIQIQRISGLRRRLGALMPRMIMVRPCHVFSDAERAMARACELDVIDQAEAPRLFSRLAGFLGVKPLPQSLADIEKTLIELISRRGRRRVFGPESKLTREQEALSGTSVLVDLEKHLDQLCAERGQNWILWATRTQVFLRLARPASPPAQMLWLIQNSLKRFGRVQVEELPSGYEAVFPRSDTVLLVLRQALAGYVNRALDPLIFIQAAPPTPPPQHKPAAKVAFSTPAGDLMDHLDSVLDNTVKPRDRSKT